MKTNYVDKGYPVIVGEFGANVRSPELSGSDLNLHKQGRVQWHKDVVTAAKQYGLTPILWDMGNESNSGYDNMAYIRRQSSPVGKVLDVDVINAMREVYSLGNYVNTGVTHVENFITGGSEPTSSSSVQPGSSSSSVPVCDAMIPECGWIDALPTVAGTHVEFYSEGNTLYGTAKISLFDMNGNLVRTSGSSAGNTELQLQGIKQGLYVAKCGNKSLKIIAK